MYATKMGAAEAIRIQSLAADKSTFKVVLKTDASEALGVVKA